MVVTCAVLLVAQCAWWRGSEGWVSGDTVAECTHFVAAEVPERQHVIMLGSFVPALQLPVGRVCVCAHVYVHHMYVVLNIIHHTHTHKIRTVLACICLCIFFMLVQLSHVCIHIHTYMYVCMYVCQLVQW